MFSTDGDDLLFDLRRINIFKSKKNLWLCKQI